ncbi:MAG: S49 family peptidase, partial [Pseudomonadota bacterium]
LGLVDGFGHMGTILKQRYGEKVKMRVIQPKRSLFGRGGAGANLMLPQEAVTGAVDSALLSAEEKALRARYGL